MPHLEAFLKTILAKLPRLIFPASLTVQELNAVDIILREAEPSEVCERVDCTSKLHCSSWVLETQGMATNGQQQGINWFLFKKS